MMNQHQQAAFANPLIGRDGDTPYYWTEGVWHFGLSFNR